MTDGGRLSLAASPTVGGPWHDVLRGRLACLDPEPGGRAEGRPHIGIEADEGLPDEGYRLLIDDTGIRIRAASAAGALQAATTVRYLLPPENWRAAGFRRDDWSLPHTDIADAPRYPYRGFMLDVARHFAPVPEILRWIDLSAMHRLNRLHLHLTDDQGWRVESAAHPAIVERATWRPSTRIGHVLAPRAEGEEYDGTPHGGYYTRADLAEICAYADSRGVIVVPEIDLPGHAAALLHAVPELGVPGLTPQSVARTWGLLGRTISPLPAAMALAADLIREVAEMIPSPYLHIGGDEADLTMWRESPEVVEYAATVGGIDRLRGLVNGQLADAVIALGRRPIVWDDAFVAGGIPSETIVMAWRTEQLGLDAALAGHDVVMTPCDPTYLDISEALDDDEPLALAAPRPLGDAAGWLPPDPPAGAAGAILGGQAQLWTEYCPSQSIREYRAFPRLSAIAHSMWSGSTPGSADIKWMLERLDACHVNYRPLTGPHPWQRAGTGRLAPDGVLPVAALDSYLVWAADRAEPPTAG